MHKEQHKENLLKEYEYLCKLDIAMSEVWMSHLTVAMTSGTFNKAIEPITERRELLEEALRKYGLYLSHYK